MKNGIYQEGDYLVYYKDDKPKHDGIIKIDDKIYYAGNHGYLAKGQKIVHREMCNGILERGTYTFDENGVLIEGSYIKPKSSHGNGSHGSGSHSNHHSSSKIGNRISHRVNKSKRNAKKQLTSVATAVKNIKSHKKNIMKAACLVICIVLGLSGAFLIDELTKNAVTAREN